MLDYKLCFIIFCLISAPIFLFPSAITAQTSIPCGQTIAGSISTVGEKDNYTFTALANDKVTIRLVVTSGGMTPYLELYDSGMTKIAYNYSSYANYTSIDKTLVAGGTYTIRVYDYGNDATGNYNLTWQKLNNPCNATSITCGQTISSSLSAVGEQDFYTFTATAGDKVTIRLIVTLGNMTPYLELYDSTGTRISYNYSSYATSTSIDATLSTGGPCTFVVSDYGNDATGNYNLTWQKLNNPCNTTAITCGQTISSSLSVTGEQDFYTFTATANDKVTIRLVVTSGTMTPYLELYDSTGRRVAYNYSSYYNSTSIDATLSIGGPCTLVVSDYGNDGAGNYNLTWQRLNNPCNATTIACGQTLSSSLSTAGEQDFYTFTANAGDNISLTLTRSSGGIDPYLELYSSSGTRIAYNYTSSGSSVTLSHTLSAGGTYSVFASDYGNDETGNYKLKFQKNNNSCPEVVVTAPNGGEVIEVGSNFTITWTSASPSGISSQEIRLSTDGGVTFSTAIATGVAGNVRSFNWPVSSDLRTTKGRIRLTVTDATGISTQDDSDADFVILQSVPKVSRTFAYDELSRLIQINYEGGTEVTYTYDAVGNRISLGGIGGSEGILSVTPSDGLISSGPQGGPFIPVSKDYTLQNTGGTSINWSASKSANWVSLSANSGPLASGASTTLTVSINSIANSLSVGSYSDTVYFSNTTNGNGNTTRILNLTVNVPSETVSTPTTPSGSSTGTIGTSYSYTTSGSTSSLGHAVEYQFDWKGDSSDLSSWGSSTQSKTWTTIGTYNVRTRSRCATHTTVVSSWSGSLSVNITTVGPNTATRDLPNCYTPSATSTVTISVSPSGTTSSYAVEDIPPNGWTVSSINENGQWDSVNKKVKWGPFSDHNNRTLTYNVTPPSGETGSKTFSGTASFDGASVAISGESSIEKCVSRPHPADTNNDYRMGINEATAYGSAWKTGQTWPTPPNPIPIEYVTNAAYLWKMGEVYHYDGSVNPPWVSGAAGVQSITRQASLQIPIASGTGSATRTLPSTYEPSMGVNVSISLNPGQGTQVYAVEETPPNGWVISDINENGWWDNVNKKVKWGPFFDANNRSLTYKATPPVGETGPTAFSGTVSFDGNNVSTWR